MDKDCVLGIDTSNYKSSIAVTDRTGKIAVDERCLLRVKKGERGLRQSEALFQHVENLPILFEALSDMELHIAAVAVSGRPRSVEGSYMPCFKAGHGFGKAVSHALNVPFFEFSHQEGHLEAIKHYTNFCDIDSFLAWHLSGGTCELLKVMGDKIEIIGGSKDISFGQVIDRIGVLLGMAFPAGGEMDSCALEEKSHMPIMAKSLCILSKIKTDGLYFNLSGIETQCSRSIAETKENALIRELFDKITTVVCKLTEAAAEQHNLKNVIFAGGVSCSNYISDEIKKNFEGKNVNVEFGIQDLSGDNAVGIALLGGKRLWL